jgi:hypothetical protein
MFKDLALSKEIMRESCIGLEGNLGHLPSQKAAPICISFIPICRIADRFIHRCMALLLYNKTTEIPFADIEARLALSVYQIVYV